MRSSGGKSTPTTTSCPDRWVCPLRRVLQVRELAGKLRDMPDRNPNKNLLLRQLLGKLHETGLIPTADTLERADTVTASSFCRRRLATMMKKVGMMKSVRGGCYERAHF